MTSSSHSSVCTGLSSEDEEKFAHDLRLSLEDLSSRSERSACSTRSIRTSLTSNSTPSSHYLDREMLAKRFETCYNSGDPDILKDQMGPLFDDVNCEVESFRLTNFRDASTEELEDTIKGKDAVLEYFAGYVRAIPDLLFFVHEWKTLDRPNRTYCVVLKFTLTGHRILHMDSVCCDKEGVPAVEEDTIIDENGDFTVGSKRSRDPSVKFKEKAPSTNFF